jgi:hypothetical protein
MADQSPIEPSVQPIQEGYFDAIQAMTNQEKLFFDIYSITAKEGVAFPAIIKNYQDTFNTNLDTITFVGHSEPLRKVKSTERQISVTLDVIAQNLNEAKNNFIKISTLVKMLYPALEERNSGLKNFPAQRFVRSGGDPLFKIRFLNFMLDGQSDGGFSSAQQSGLKGYMDNVSYSMDFDSGVFKEQLGMLYPQNIELSFTYFPFHEQAPGWILGADKKNNQTKPQFSAPSIPYAVGKDKIQTATNYVGKVSAASIAAVEAAIKKVLG